MKTADLVAGKQTDALAALAQDWEYELCDQLMYWFHNPTNTYMYDIEDYSPSTTPSQWAELIPLIANIIIEQDGDWYYIYSCDIEAIQGQLWLSSDVKLGLAICKAVIAAKWGDVIPDEIWEKVK